MWWDFQKEIIFVSESCHKKYLQFFRKKICDPTFHTVKNTHIVLPRTKIWKKLRHFFKQKCFSKKLAHLLCNNYYMNKKYSWDINFKCLLPRNSIEKKFLALAKNFFLAKNPFCGGYFKTSLKCYLLDLKQGFYVRCTTVEQLVAVVFCKQANILKLVE